MSQPGYTRPERFGFVCLAAIVAGVASIFWPLQVIVVLLVFILFRAYIAR